MELLYKSISSMSERAVRPVTVSLPRPVGVATRTLYKEEIIPKISPAKELEMCG